MASPASYTSIACLGLSPKCHPSLQHLSALRSHGASSSPRIQTERLLPSPPRPTPLPLSTAQMGVPRCPSQTGQSHPGQSHHPLLLMTPGQSPSPAPSLPHAPPPCHVHLPVSVSFETSTTHPQAPCIRPVSNGLSKMQCNHADLFERVHSGFLFFPFENNVDVHRSSGFALYLCLQCDLLSVTHSLSMYDAHVMHTVLMQCVNSGM